YATLRCRNENQADDLVHKTLLRACTGINAFRPDTSMCAWLLTKLRSHFYSEWNVAGPREVNLGVAETMTSRSAQAEASKFRYALAKLHPEWREALILICASGLSY